MTTAEVESVDVQQQAREISESIRQLGTQLIQDLFARLERATADYRRDSAQKAEEAVTLRASYDSLRPRTESRVRVLRIDLDRAVSEGRDQDAERLRREVLDLEANLQQILERATACEERSQQLQEQMRTLARPIFEVTFPLLRGAHVTIQQAISDGLDAAWEGMQRFNEQAGNPLSTPLLESYRSDLTAREHGSEAPVFMNLRLWFGGRR